MHNDIHNVGYLYSLNNIVKPELNFPLNIICKVEGDAPTKELNKVYNDLVDKNVLSAYTFLEKTIIIDNKTISKLDRIEKAVEDAIAVGSHFIVFDLLNLKTSYIKEDTIGKVVFAKLINFMVRLFNEESLNVANDKTIYTVLLKPKAVNSFINAFKDLSSYFQIGLNFFDAKDSSKVYLDVNLLRDEVMKLDDSFIRLIKTLEDNVAKIDGKKVAFLFDMKISRFSDVRVDNLEDVLHLINEYNSLSDEDKKQLKNIDKLNSIVAIFNVKSKKYSITEDYQIIEKPSKPTPPAPATPAGPSEPVGPKNPEEPNNPDDSDGKKPVETKDDGYDWDYKQVHAEYMNLYHNDQNHMATKPPKTFPGYVYIKESELVDGVSSLENFAERYAEKNGLVYEKLAVSDDVIEISRQFKKLANPSNKFYFIDIRDAERNNNLVWQIRYDLIKLRDYKTLNNFIIVAVEGHQFANTYSPKTKKLVIGKTTIVVDLNEFLVDDTDDSNEPPVTNPKPTPTPKPTSKFNSHTTFIGMNQAKQMLNEILTYIKKEKKRIAAGGTHIESVNNNIILTGNPGTGKSTFAKYIGEVFTREGIINENKFTMVSREDLVGPYIGHTEEKVKKLLEKAKGGILFIDEAYRLIVSTSDNNNDFGKTALEQLLLPLENDRSTIYIFAGYEDKMQLLNKVNPGVLSRFGHKINIEDYSSKELFMILLSFCYSMKDVILEDSYLKTSARLIKYIHKYRSSDFGNARAMRNIKDASVTSCFSRDDGVKGKNFIFTSEDIYKMLDKQNNVCCGVNTTNFERE